MRQRYMTIVLMPLLGLLTLAAVLLFPGLGASPIERAEIYFLDGARNMVERQDYLVPYYRGQPFFDRPALTYWLMAASFQTFGFTLSVIRSLYRVKMQGNTVWVLILGPLPFLGEGEQAGFEEGRQQAIGSCRGRPETAGSRCGRPAGANA
jgi:hypothetical protein